ncbi:MAG: sugar transferase [Rhodococcus sp. (in: high G+C Gram-positive bacteria)]|uniref:sugar transferase n=1 Tax=Rhodococcus sp. TaxID=1831 RepID=UPI003BB79060
MTPETEHMAGQCRSGAHDQRDRAHEQDTVEAVVSERWKWQRAYVSRLRWTDAVVVVLAVALAQQIRFGGVAESVSGAGVHSSYTVVSVGLVAAWLVMLAGFRTRSTRVIGSGTDEYQRIISSTLWLFGGIAIVSLLLRMDLARGYLAIALPIGLLALLLSRWLWRIAYARRRNRGEARTSVLLVGDEATVRVVGHTFAERAEHGHHIVGAYVPGGVAAPGAVLDVDGRAVPLFGDDTDVLTAVRASGADTVAVTAAQALGPDGIRDLMWQLEQHDVDLLVSPGISGVSGPRLNVRPVGTLPFVSVERPTYHGAKRSGKRLFDLTFAVAILLVLAPVLVFLALAIKIDSRGPVFYRSERIGLNGTPFGMIKFRSMVVDADRHLAELTACNEGAGPLFKVRNDPRVTRVGRVIRRYSLDELPQFFNVLAGDMNVVGPRPPLRREVETYDGVVARRLLVRPGVTGLWQVSGRSDLSWDDAVRLDLSYVENWSMVSDLVIVARTVKAVVSADGAY